MKRTSRSPVLVVDDTEDDIYFFQLLLKRIGATAPFVGLRSGEEAIAWLGPRMASDASAELPFVCFLDMKMPMVSGLDVLSWIRARPNFGAMPVVLLSSSDDERDIGGAADAGAQAYLQKYPSTAALSEVLAHASAFADNPGVEDAFNRPYNLLLPFRAFSSLT